MKSSLILFLVAIWFCTRAHAGLGTKLDLPSDLNSKKDFTVFVFMNKNCPCTNHNLKYLNSLKDTYGNVDFIGIHSLKNTSEEDTQRFTTEKEINFNVIEDGNLSIANLFQANRTPQVFITNKNKEVVYIGGVTNRTNPETATEFFLKDSLRTIKNTNNLAPTEHRSLGCFIVR